MKKIFLSALNKIMVGSGFIIATFSSTHLTRIWALVAFICAYIILDLHTYFEKKLNYPNNIFIKN